MNGTDDVTSTESEGKIFSLTNDLLSKIAWLFLILPGFLSYSSASLISSVKVQSEFEVLAFSFAYLLVNLSLTLAIFVGISTITRRLWKISWNRKVRTVPYFFVILVAISPITGIVGGVMLERDIFFKFAKAIPFISIPIQDSIHAPLDRILLQNHTGLNTNKNPNADGRIYPNDSVDDTNQAYARITTIYGAIYEGWPLYFDTRESQEQIYLTPACRIITSTTGIDVFPISGPGIVIYEHNIHSLVLLDLRTTICSSYWLTPPEVRSNIPELATLNLIGRETDPTEILKNIESFIP